MEVKNILVAVDFSPFSEAASKFALFLARKFKARVTLLHAVVLFDEDTSDNKYLKQLEEIALKKEETSASMMENHRKKNDENGADVSVKIVRGVSASDAILDFINSNTAKIDLLVLGTHGRTGFKKWLFGSVAEKVLRLSPIPVLTIHKVPRDITIKNILVPIDFSENSRQAIPEAQSLAKLFDAQLHYIHVIEEQLHPSFQVIGIESIFAINPELRQISQDKLIEFCHSDKHKGNYVVMEGASAETIKEYAEEHAVDLILMATHGYTGLEHLLLGSTTERLVRIAPCPVLTVGRKG